MAASCTQPMNYYASLVVVLVVFKLVLAALFVVPSVSKQHAVGTVAFGAGYRHAVHVDCRAPERYAYKPVVSL